MVGKGSEVAVGGGQVEVGGGVGVGGISVGDRVAVGVSVGTGVGLSVGVGVTGIAGPSGGTPEKPVGTVVVAVVTDVEHRVRTYRFFGEREQVKFQASQAALDTVRRMLQA